MLTLAMLAAAQVPAQTESTPSQRTPLVSEAMINSLSIDAKGKISGCKLQPLGETTLRDDPTCIGALELRTFADVLPHDLATVSKIDIRMIFQVEGKPPVVPTEIYDAQTVIYSAVVDVAPDGAPSKCELLIARPFAGRKPMDPCLMLGPGHFSGKSNSPDPEGLPRKVDATLDISIKLRTTSNP